MKKSDILIIGNGISGLFAACVAAKKGKDVTLLSYGRGTLAIACGYIDILGYDDKGDIVKNPFDEMENLNNNHPYKKLGKEVAKEAIDEFLNLTKEAGYEYIGNDGKNMWIPTAIGNFKPTYLVPKTTDGKHVKNADNILVVGFKLLKDFYSHIVVKNFKERLKNKASIEEINILLDNFETGRDLRDVTALDVARWMETEHGYNSFVNQVKPRIKQNTCIVIPPILGLKPNYDLLEKLEKDLNAKIVEVAAIPPAVNGLRLSKMLTTMAKKLGVRIIEKAKAISSIVENDKCIAVTTEGFDRPRNFYADKFILATGGIYGGGLEAGIGTLKEPIFNIDINVPKKQTEWSNKDLFSQDKQIFAMYGVDTDKELHPILNNKKILKNVKVVGRSLAGYDYCFEKSGNGVALITAYMAATSLSKEE